MNPTQFRKISSPQFIALQKLDKTDEKIYNTIYYKEVPVVTGSMDKVLIVIYSPKFKAYQINIYTRQMQRAEKIIASPGRKKGKNQNAPMCFTKRSSVTEICQKR